jgi:hypothetical protein
MRDNFSKTGKITMRRTRHGETLYSGITLRDEYLIHIIRSLHERTGKSPSKILQKFIIDAFEAGLTPGI